VEAADEEVAMVPSEIRDRLREGIGPALVAHGFGGRSSTFSRPVGDVVHLVQLQGADDNSSEGARFTVNVAVWVPALSTGTTPSVADAHWQVRLGLLGPERADRWWEANDLAMADAAALDIVAWVQAFALPALARIQHARDLVALWKSGESPGLTRLQADRFRQRLEGAGK
jgi:hypothetical protein